MAAGYQAFDGLGLMNCRRTSGALAAAKARLANDEIAAIARAVGGRLHARVGPCLSYRIAVHLRR